MELAYIDHGGILPYVIRNLIKQWYFVFPFLVRLLRYTCDVWYTINSILDCLYTYVALVHTVTYTCLKILTSDINVNS